MKPVGKIGAFCLLLFLLFSGADAAASGLGRACTDQCDASYIAASADGSEILFSSARPLTRDDKNQSGDIYLWKDGVVTLRSKTPKGLYREQDWSYPIWADFRSDTEARAVFSTVDSFSPADTDKGADVYEVTPAGLTLLTDDSIFDRPCEKTCHISSSTYSEDGNIFFFESKFPLMNEDTDSRNDAYRYENGEVTLASGGPLAGGSDSYPVGVERGAASPDGSEFYFETAEVLDPADTDRDNDAYVNRNGEVHLVSPWASNNPGGFNLQASTVVPGRFFMKTWSEFEGIEYRGMIYMAEGGNLYRLNLPGENTGGSQPEIEGESPDGETVFFSTESALDPRDLNDHSDLYAWRNGSVELMNVGPRSSDSGHYGRSHLAFPGEGGDVFFYSSDQLVAADSSGDTDLYLRSGGETTLISTDTKGRSGGGGADFVERFDEGRKIAIITADRWTPEDRDDGQDLYVREGNELALITKGPAKKRSSYRYNPMFNRYLGENRYVISTDSPLVAEDSDRNEDVYLVDLDDPESPWLVSESPLQITSGPIGKVRTKPPFSFSFRQVGARPAFECSIDLEPFRPCKSPLVLRNVKRGGHKVRVRSTGPAGLGPRPAASRRFTYDPGRSEYWVDPRLNLISPDTKRIQFDIESPNHGPGPEFENRILRQDVAEPEPFQIARGDMRTVGTDRDGNTIVFRTRRSLTEADDDPYSDLYRWTDEGVELVPAGLNLIDSPTLGGVSDDGESLFFATRQQLAPADTDQATDAYVAGPEGIRLMSAGNSMSMDIRPFFISGDGSAVIFDTAEAIDPVDSDGKLSIYWSDGESVRFVASGGLNKDCSDCGEIYSDPSPDWFSEDGSRIVLTTGKRLLGADLDRDQDIYEWTTAGLRLVTEAEDPLISFDAELAYSGSGLGWEPRDVAPYPDWDAAIGPDGSMLIETREKLLTEDQDMNFDVYRSRNGNLELLDSAAWPKQGKWVSGASRDLSTVVVRTRAQLVPGDTDDDGDLYRLRDGKATRLTLNDPDEYWNGHRVAWISKDGNQIAITSRYPYVKADRDQFASDLYFWNRGRMRLVSKRPGELDDIPIKYLQTGLAGQYFYFETGLKVTGDDLDRKQDLYRISRSGKIKRITG